jgi:hypothetical protein
MTLSIADYPGDRTYSQVISACVAMWRMNFCAKSAKRPSTTVTQDSWSSDVPYQGHSGKCLGRRGIRNSCTMVNVYPVMNTTMRVLLYQWQAIDNKLHVSAIRLP